MLLGTISTDCSCIIFYLILWFRCPQVKLFQLESADSSSPYTKKPDKRDDYESVASDRSQDFVCENTYLDLITDSAADYM